MSVATTSRYAEPGLPLWREAFAGLDWLALRMSPVFAGVGVERGRGEAVLLVPGLFAADAWMSELRRWLERSGYRAYESGFGVNALRSEALICRLVETIDQAYDETGAPVRLIGHSLGGVVARGAALRRPDRVSQVITLGSPVDGLRAHPVVLSAAMLIHRDDIDRCLDTVQQPLPAGVSETNIYSQSDGVVDWRSCHRADATAVEVRSSHTGLIVNADAYGAIGAALAEKVGHERRSARTSARCRIERATTDTGDDSCATRFAA